MADTAWRKSKDKVTAKRGKKRDAGDTTHKLLKGNELTVNLGADSGHEGNLIGP